jgi:hypothetical protein
MGMQKVKVRVKRKLPQAMIDAQFQPGQTGNPEGKNGGGRGPTLYSIIQKQLNSRSKVGSGTRRDDVADGFLKQAEGGSFIHAKEILDREEGKVPSRLADADGGKLKMYGQLPLEGEDAP